MVTRAMVMIGALALTLVISTRAWAEETSPASDVSAVEGRSWQPGQPLPYGYRAVRKRTLGILGVSLLGGGYALSVISGLALMTSCDIPVGEGSGSTCHQSISTSSGALLLLPIAGPFVALTRSDVQKDGGAVGWFAVFGATQVVGAGLLAYYWSKPKYRLEQSAYAHVMLLPIVEPYHQGLWLSGRF